VLFPLKEPKRFFISLKILFHFRDLSTKLQDTLDFIEESIDVTLAKLCSNFNSHIYQRLLNAYHLLGKSLTFMDQLQMHFVNVVQTRTLDILLKTIGTTKNDRNLSSYIDLCKVNYEFSFISKSFLDLFRSFQKNHLQVVYMNLMYVFGK